MKNKETVPNNFQMSSDILEQRKKTWEALFLKYSPMISQIKLNMDTFQPYVHHNSLTQSEQRIPMRKPMYMIQYWINTGNQPYTKDSINASQSDSASYLDEEKQSKLYYSKNLKLSKSNFNIKDKSKKKNTIIKNQCIAYSSNSSGDTFTYILANDNTVKEADNMVFKKDSESMNKKNNYFIESLTKSNNLKKTMDYKDFEESVHTEGSNIQSVTYSDSDELIFTGNFINNLKILNCQKSLSQNTISSNRKKLYKDTNSEVEFTPVSDISSYNYSVSFKKCFNHPVLQTPMICCKSSSIAEDKHKKINKRHSSFISSKYYQKKDNKHTSKINNIISSNVCKIQDNHKIFQFKSHQLNCNKVDKRNNNSDNSSPIVQSSVKEVCNYNNKFSESKKILFTDKHKENHKHTEKHLVGLGKLLYCEPSKTDDINLCKSSDLFIQSTVISSQKQIHKKSFKTNSKYRIASSSDESEIFINNSEDSLNIKNQINKANSKINLTKIVNDQTDNKLELKNVFNKQTLEKLNMNYFSSPSESDKNKICNESSPLSLPSTNEEIFSPIEGRIWFNNQENSNLNDIKSYFSTKNLQLQKTNLTTNLFRKNIYKNHFVNNRQSLDKVVSFQKQSKSNSLANKINKMKFCNSLDSEDWQGKSMKSFICSVQENCRKPKHRESVPKKKRKFRHCSQGDNKTKKKKLSIMNSSIKNHAVISSEEEDYIVYEKNKNFYKFTVKN